ncbi:MAG: carboxypeptidase M32 [Deltaproteobacteria bacterium]|nr:carboxypeptidase M32 [Deltaproteobacteria bacterium]
MDTENLHQHPKLTELTTRLTEIADLRSAAQILEWDQSTYMPSGGAAARGRQLSTLARLAHEKLTDDAVARLLEELAPLERELPVDSTSASLIRVARRDHQRATRIPTAFTARLQDHLSNSFNTWAKARPANDFAAVRPLLERTLELSRELSSFFPEAAHPADPLIDYADQGMTAASVRALFKELLAELGPLAAAITAQPLADASCLEGHFPEADQLGFGREVITRLGYDWERGRQDKTHHPFMTRFALGDIRITTRVKEHDLGEALFSTVHEAGHAMYEQGTAPELDGGPLGEGASAGVHESQSRLWENVVGRSRGFWGHFYPSLQRAFPALAGVPLDSFYRAINRVERSLIRTDADEVTYNLHVIIRFDLELEMLEGKLAVKDLPAAWNARYQRDLGLTPPADKDGCMQDVHWFAGPIGGAFQGYTLGNILSGQFYAAAVAGDPGIPDAIARGEFAPLRRWLTDHVYRHGRKFSAPELIQRATGQPLTIAPYLGYLRAKYRELYSL